jgi:hypothetical protein
LADENYELLLLSRPFWAQTTKHLFFNGVRYKGTRTLAETLNLFRADYDEFTTRTSGTPESTLVEGCDRVANFEMGSDQAETRFSNFVTLRPTARSAIITANALQKVFRARFEDSRAHSHLTQLSALTTAQPFLSAGRIPYEASLGKTKANFAHLSHYHPKFAVPLEHIHGLKTAQRYSYYSFPFLLSPKSDMGRYV